jgi:hypothetical protein
MELEIELGTLMQFSKHGPEKRLTNNIFIIEPSICCDLINKPLKNSHVRIIKK